MKTTAVRICTQHSKNSPQDQKSNKNVLNINKEEEQMLVGSFLQRDNKSPRTTKG